MTTIETLERIEKSIQATNELLSVAEKYYKEDYRIFEYFGVLKKPDEYKRELLYLKSLREVVEYLGQETSIKIGKYLSVDVTCDFGNVCIGLYLEDYETENRLYNNVFGSHSGINEFIQKHIPELISPILGDTKYSYSFGSYDFSELFGDQLFGKNDNGRYYGNFELEKYTNDIKRVKAKIDYLRNLSKNETLLAEIDNW